MDSDRLLHSAGHGGTDSGAISLDRKVREKDLNITMAAKVADRMAALAPWIEQEVMVEDIKLTGTQEMAAVRAYGPRLAIAHHHNGGGGSGAEVIYSVDGSGKDLAADLGAALDRAGMPLRRTFCRESGSRRGKDYYYFLRDRGEATAVIIEYGFIDNPLDLAMLTDPDTQDRLAEAVARVVVKWFVQALEPPEPETVTVTPTRVKMDGVDLPGIIIKGRCYLPVREMVNVGYLVGWDGKTVTMKRRG